MNNYVVAYNNVNLLVGNNTLDNTWLKKKRNILIKEKRKNNFYQIYKINMSISQYNSDRFISWLVENGAYVNSKSSWGRSSHPCYVSNETFDEEEFIGRGLIASRNILKNEKIIEISENLMFDKFEHNLEINSNGSDNYSDLAIKLLVELFKNKKSFWFPYIGILPEEYDLKLLFRWPLKELFFIKGSRLSKASDYLKKKLKAQYEMVNKEVFQRNRLLYPSKIFNYQNWEWSMSILLSRTISLQETKKVVLIPYIDLLNHNPFSSSFISYRKIPLSDSKEIVVYSDKNCNKFDQLYISYGQKSNLELLNLYGFIAERNPYDSVIIRISMSPKDIFFKEKKSFLFSNKKFFYNSYPIFLYKYPDEMIEFIKICLFNTNINDKNFNLNKIENYDYTKIIKSCIVTVIEKSLNSNYNDYENLRNIMLKENLLHISDNQKISIKYNALEKKILNRFLEQIKI